MGRGAFARRRKCTTSEQPSFGVPRRERVPNRTPLETPFPREKTNALPRAPPSRRSRSRRSRSRRSRSRRSRSRRSRSRRSRSRRSRSRRSRSRRSRPRKIRRRRRSSSIASRSSGIRRRAFASSPRRPRMILRRRTRLRTRPSRRATRSRPRPRASRRRPGRRPRPSPTRARRRRRRRAKRRIRFSPLERGRVEVVVIVVHHVFHVVAAVHLHAAHARVAHGLHHALHVDVFLVHLLERGPLRAILRELGRLGETRPERVLVVVSAQIVRRERPLEGGAVDEHGLRDVGVAVGHDLLARELHRLALLAALAERVLAHELHLERRSLLDEVVLEQPLARLRLRVARLLHHLEHVGLLELRALGPAELRGLARERLRHLLAHLAPDELDVGLDRARGGPFDFFASATDGAEATQSARSARARGVRRRDRGMAEGARGRRRECRECRECRE